MPQLLLTVKSLQPLIECCAMLGATQVAHMMRVRKWLNFPQFTHFFFAFCHLISDFTSVVLRQSLIAVNSYHVMKVV